MPTSRRFLPRAWVIAVCAAVALAALVHRTRFAQAARLTAVAEWSCDAPAEDPQSITGLSGGVRRLVAPIHDSRSLEAIAQAQSILAGGPWRVRRVDSDNAPAGRPTHATLPHRLWLAGLAWVDHVTSGRPMGLSVERAALVSDPILHGLIVLGAGLLCGWRLGGLAATLVALGAASWFPAATQFVAGASGPWGLAWGCTLVSLLLLVAGLEAARTGARPHGWLAASGGAGGLALWIDAGAATPVILAVSAGVIVAAASTRWRGVHLGSTVGRSSGCSAWHAWALTGGGLTLVAWAIEYAPALPDRGVVALHPLLGLAWIGAGDVLARFTRWGGRESVVRGRRDAVLGLLGVAAVVALPVALMVAREDSLWSRDPWAGQLARLGCSEVATSLAAWMRKADTPACVAAVLLAGAILAAAAGCLFRRPREKTDARRDTIVILGGASAVVLAWALVQVRIWSAADALCLALLAHLAGNRVQVRRSTQIAAAVGCAAACLAGLVALWPDRAERDPSALPKDQVTRLFERDLAHWLRLRAGPSEVVVLAPPAASVNLAYHGGMRGVCSLDSENREGFAAAVRIVAATTFEEARTLIERRGITHLVFPSWDTTLDRYAGFGLGENAEADTLERSFIMRLRRGLLPDWLRAVPQQLPSIPGLEPQSVAVFEVVEDQEHAEALSRLAEYYVEMNEPARAAALIEEMRRYPSDLGLRAALVHVAAARGDRSMLGDELDGVRTLLASGADEYLAWDRRLSLAIVLAQAKQAEAARAQLQRCLAEADEPVLRHATASELFRLLTLARRFDLTFPDESRERLARQLLPPDFRKRL